MQKTTETGSASSPNGGRLLPEITLAQAPLLARQSVFASRAADTKETACRLRYRF